MAANQPHTKRDAGGDKPEGKTPGNPSKDTPGKPSHESGSKGKKDSGGNK